MNWPWACVIITGIIFTSITAIIIAVAVTQKNDKSA